MAKNNNCVAWVGMEGNEYLNPQIGFCLESAEIYGYEIVSFYGDKERVDVELMLNDILNNNIKTLAIPSIISVCDDLKTFITTIRKIFDNNITVLNFIQMKEMHNMHDFISCLSDELYSNEEGYNNNFWYYPDETNEIEYGELYYME